MAGHGRHTSGSSSKCPECVRIRIQGHRNAWEPGRCERHQCVYTDASGIMCTNHKKTDDLRCNIHMICKEEDCDMPRMLDDRGVPCEYCSDHTCFFPSCEEGKVNNAPRGYRQDLCATHIGQVCAVKSCLEFRTETGVFCNQHTCRLETCREKIVSESRPWCRDHNICCIEGCSGERCQFGNVFEDVCRRHHLPPCANPRCSHKSSPPSRYCDMHSCQHKLCEKEATPLDGKPFCRQHKCMDDGCQALRTFRASDDGTLRMNDYCTAHECKDPGCRRHQCETKPYCNSHCCEKPGCPSKRDGHARFLTLCYPHHREELFEEARQTAAREEAPRQPRTRPYPGEQTQHDPRFNPSPPRRFQDGFRQGRPHSYYDAHEDEGYRSNPTTPQRGGYTPEYMRR